MTPCGFGRQASNTGVSRGDTYFRHQRIQATAKGGGRQAGVETKQKFVILSPRYRELERVESQTTTPFRKTTGPRQGRRIHLNPHPAGPSQVTQVTAEAIGEINTGPAAFHAPQGPARLQTRDRNVAERASSLDRP